MKIAILIPFYNEEKNLIFFIKEWEKILINKQNIKKNLFFLFLNDGSTDQSVKVIKKNIRNLKYLIISRKNSGHGNICKFGYKLILKKYKKFNYILQIDSDNQCDPKYFFKMYNMIKLKNYNFIFGYRNIRDDGYLRFLISRVLSLTVFLKTLVFVKDLNTPYRLMKISELSKILYLLNKNDKYDKIKLFNCILSY